MADDELQKLREVMEALHRRVTILEAQRPQDDNWFASYSGEIHERFEQHLKMIELAHSRCSDLHESFCDVGKHVRDLSKDYTNLAKRVLGHDKLLYPERYTEKADAITDVVRSKDDPV